MKADKFAAVRRSDGYALSEERLNWHLDNWKAWEMAKWDAELAYTLSHGDSYSVDFDEMCAQMDRMAADATKAAIESLTPCESCAVYHRVLAAVFRLRDSCGTVESAWFRARWKLAQTLYKRGLV